MCTGGGSGVSTRLRAGLGGGGGEGVLGRGVSNDVDFVGGSRRDGVGFT